MVLSIDNLCQLSITLLIITFISNFIDFLQVKNTNQLLIKLTGPIMHAPERIDVSLIDPVASGYLWIAEIAPVITKNSCFIRCKSKKAMDKHYRILILPEASWQVVI